MNCRAGVLHLGRIAAAVAIAVVAGPDGAAAHVPGTHGAGFGHGFAHPFGGLDHLLAMVAVGLWAALRGGRLLWGLPAAFLAAMAAGGLLGLAGAPLVLVEPGIAASVLVLGLALALSFRPPAALGLAIVGLSGLLHGYAHGAEIPAAAAPVPYALGFLLATALLHGLGIGALLAAMRTRLGMPALRLTGAAVAASGLLLIAG